MNRAKQLPLYGMYVLLGYMPFHVFVSQSASLLTGGLEIWKLAKDVVVALLAAICVLLVWRKTGLKNNKFNWVVGAAAIYTLLHLGLYTLFRDTPLDVALLATMYNVRPLLLLIIGVSVMVLFGKKIKLQQIIKLVLVVSTIVAALGVVQYFLPTDFLTNFGYSEARGAKPSFLIDNKADLPRITSTIREPNSLGAFLILPILILSYKFLADRRKMLFGGLLLLHGLALLLTFSRSAWSALLISQIIFVATMYRAWLVAFCKKYAPILISAVLLLGFSAYALRDQYFVQNVIFHSDENTVAELDSNEKHLSHTAEGVEAITEQPAGHGPGTAGPVSMHTDAPIITENYYVQLGYEVGILGLLLFAAICVAAFVALKKVGTPIARALLAAFIGYAICNLLLHTWANEAVVTQWWLLAGLVIGSLPEFARKAVRR